MDRTILAIKNKKLIFGPIDLLSEDPNRYAYMVNPYIKRPADDAATDYLVIDTRPGKYLPGDLIYILSPEPDEMRLKLPPLRSRFFMSGIMRYLGNRIDINDGSTGRRYSLFTEPDKVYTLHNDDIASMTLIPCGRVLTPENEIKQEPDGGGFSTAFRGLCPRMQELLTDWRAAAKAHCALF